MINFSALSVDRNCVFNIGLKPMFSRFHFDFERVALHELRQPLVVEKNRRAYEKNSVFGSIDKKQ